MLRLNGKVVKGLPRILKTWLPSSRNSATPMHRWIVVLKLNRIHYKRSYAAIPDTTYRKEWRWYTIQRI